MTILRRMANLISKSKSETALAQFSKVANNKNQGEL